MKKPREKIKVYATHSTSIIWYLHPTNDISYYEKLVGVNEISNGVYLSEINNIKST